jgi:hypothetical protein
VQCVFGTALAGIAVTTASATPATRHPVRPRRITMRHPRRLPVCSAPTGRLRRPLLRGDPFHPAARLVGDNKEVSRWKPATRC